MPLTADAKPPCCSAAPIVSIAVQHELDLRRIAVLTKSHSSTGTCRVAHVGVVEHYVTTAQQRPAAVTRGVPTRSSSR
jgi:hypothetical protein